MFDILKSLFKRKPKKEIHQHDWEATDVDSSSKSEQLFRCRTCPRHCFAGGESSYRRYKQYDNMLEEDKSKITMLPALTWD